MHKKKEEVIHKIQEIFIVVWNSHSTFLSFPCPKIVGLPLLHYGTNLYTHKQNPGLILQGLQLEPK